MTFVSGTNPQSAPSLRGRIVALYIPLIAFNIAAWVWALWLFWDQPLLLSTALLAYGFGLRHAVDADHIAAIDNVTRKLMQGGQRPISVGLFFALGHSTVVVLAAALIALTTTAMAEHFEELKSIGGLVSTSISAFFLFAIAAMNVLILRGVWRAFRQVRRGGGYQEEDINLLLSGRGLMARLFRPMFKMINSAWQMLPLGFLFGLGFETTTEVALLSVSATQAADGFSFGTIMVFPALFAAGMTLVDTTDGILMLGAYDWAFVKPIRKLYYNLIITLVSIIVAVLIGGIELLVIIGERWKPEGWFWDVVARLGDNFNSLGFIIIGVFGVTWLGSMLIYRYTGLDRLELAGSTQGPPHDR